MRKDHFFQEITDILLTVDPGTVLGTDDRCATDAKFLPPTLKLSYSCANKFLVTDDTYSNYAQMTEPPCTDALRTSYTGILSNHSGFSHIPKCSADI